MSGRGAIVDSRYVPDRKILPAKRELLRAFSAVGEIQGSVKVPNMPAVGWGKLTDDGSPERVSPAGATALLA